MQHALMYHGGFEANARRLKPGSSTFLGSDGTEKPLPDWPEEAEGLCVGYMEKAGKKFVAVRVLHGDSDVVLENEMLIDPPSHMGYGKRFSPEPTLIEDEVAKHLLRDIMERNPGQRDALAAIREAMPW